MPRFSIKQALWAMAVFAGIAYCLSNAWNGGAFGLGWIVGIVLFVFAVPVSMVAVLLLASLFSTVMSAPEDAIAPDSPTGDSP